MYTYSASYEQSSVSRLSRLNDKLSYVNVKFENLNLVAN